MYFVVIDSILPDPSWSYNSNSDGNRNNEYFNGQTLSEIRSRRRMTTGVSFYLFYWKEKFHLNIDVGKKLAIILGSVLGGLFLLGLSIFFTILLCRNKIGMIMKPLIIISNLPVVFFYLILQLHQSKFNDFIDCMKTYFLFITFIFFSFKFRKGEYVWNTCVYVSLTFILIDSKQYAPVQTAEQPRYKIQRSPQGNFDWPKSIY